MNKDKILHVRIDEEEKEIIQARMKDDGFNEATATRQIIREWAKMKKEFVTVPIKGFIRDEVLSMERSYIDRVLGDETQDEDIERRR